jgi:hypothetical protein
LKKYFKTYNTKTIIDVSEEFEYIALNEDLSVWAYINKPVRRGGTWCDFVVGSWFAVAEIRKINCKPYCDHWSRSLRRLYPVRER